MIKYDDNVEQRYGIKLLDDKTIRKQAIAGGREYYECMQSICFHFMERPDPTVVPIYSFELVEGPGNDVNGRYVNHVYTYTMIRLAMLTSEEKDIIHLGSQVHYYGMNHLSLGDQDTFKVVSKMYPELVKFMDEVRRLGRYSDIHDGNFLKDEEGNYKIIDLEGFVRLPFDRADNDWLRGK